MNIRGHHLLCIFGFRGLGYNGQFAKRMGLLIENLKSNSSQTFGLADGADSICENCPNLIDSQCHKNGSRSETDIRVRDSRVLSILEINEKELTFDKLKEHLQKADLHKLLASCADCSWFGLGHCERAFKKIVGKTVSYL